MAGRCSAAEKVEHYEISSYSSLIEFAGLLSLPRAVALFNQSLAEEEQTAAQLEQLLKELGPKMDYPLRALARLCTVLSGPVTHLAGGKP